MCSRLLGEPTPGDRCARCAHASKTPLSCYVILGRALISDVSLVGHVYSAAMTMCTPLCLAQAGVPDCDSRCVCAVLQAEAMKLNKPLVVVGTPGRLAELSRAGTLQSHNTTILVLDEVGQAMQPSTLGVTTNGKRSTDISKVPAPLQVQPCITSLPVKLPFAVL